MNRLIKNNAGYDIKHVFVGSEGTLGIITRLVLRLREKPRSQDVAIAAVPTFEALTKLLKHIDSALGGSLSAFEVMWQSFYRLVTNPPARSLRRAFDARQSRFFSLSWTNKRSLCRPSHAQ
jgi:FAD/FMN-containing dehydrogenase